MYLLEMFFQAELLVRTFTQSHLLEGPEPSECTLSELHRLFFCADITLDAPTQIDVDLMQSRSEKTKLPFHCHCP